MVGDPVAAPALAAQPTNTRILTAETVDIWKVAIDVQQHFNDLELQIRNFAVTMLAAVIGATAFAFKEHYVIKVGATDLSVAVAVLCAGMVGWLAFYFMDRYWYHSLLVASVKHSGEIEKEFESKSPEMGLSRAIGRGSPLKVWKFQIHSSAKIDLFYATGLTVLILMTMGAILAPDAPPTNDRPGKTACERNLGTC